LVIGAIDITKFMNVLTRKFVPTMGQCDKKLYRKQWKDALN